MWLFDLEPTFFFSQENMASSQVLATRVFQKNDNLFEIIAADQWIQKYSVNNSSHVLFQRLSTLYDHFKKKVYVEADQSKGSITLSMLKNSKRYLAAPGDKYDVQVETFLFVNAQDTIVSLSVFSNGERTVDILPGEPIAFVSGTHFFLSRAHPDYQTTDSKFREIVYIGEIMKYPNLKGSAAQILYEFMYGLDGPWRKCLIFLEVEKRTDPNGELSALYMKRGFVPTHLFYNPEFVTQFDGMREIGDFFLAEYENQKLGYHLGPDFICYLEKPTDNPQTTNHLFVLFPKIQNFQAVVDADRPIQHAWQAAAMTLPDSSHLPPNGLYIASDPATRKRNMHAVSNGPNLRPRITKSASKNTRKSRSAERQRIAS